MGKVTFQRGLPKEILLLQINNLWICTWYKIQRVHSITQDGSARHLLVPSFAVLRGEAPVLSIAWGWLTFVVTSELQEPAHRDFPGGPVVKNPPCNAGDTGSIPGQGTKTPQALQPKIQNIEEKWCCNKFHKALKNGPHQKVSKKQKNQQTFEEVGEEMSKPRKQWEQWPWTGPVLLERGEQRRSMWGLGAVEGIRMSLSVARV